MIKFVALVSLCLALVAAQGPPRPPGPPPDGQMPPDHQQQQPQTNLLRRFARQMPGGMPDPTNMAGPAMDMIGQAANAMAQIPQAAGSVPMGMLDAARDTVHQMIGQRKRRAPQEEPEDTTAAVH